MSEAQKAKRPRRYVFDGEAAMMARLRKGWTQKDVMNECKRLKLPVVDDSNLAQYERGKLTPRPQTLHSLATVLGVPVDELVSPRTEDAA